DGDDVLQGLGGNDALNGDAGNDTASYSASPAGVTVSLATGLASGGDAQGDTFTNFENIIGSGFADVLTGNSGNNALNGGAGNDRLTGGLGQDVLTGGPGADTFDFNALNETPVGNANHDVIADFQQGSDVIDLTGIDANANRAGNQAFRFISTQDFSGRAGDLHYQSIDQVGTANDATVISGDANGDRVADFEIHLAGLFQMTSNDFLL
ncbi:MAG TPA: M10 family metallopeptidase C-terminal domain-containing protein, partial [Pseudolabrys sp.]|nr:M10 family metallopeptidase C-terminal domain-containing protein [Pseudolabrys sp.]